MKIGSSCQIDILEWKLPLEVLDVLLKDRTTGDVDKAKNIVWGTKDYERQFGAGKGERAFVRSNLQQTVL